MRPVQDIFFRHVLSVDHQRRSELEGVDDLFSVDFLLVEGGQLRSALVNVEIAVLINQQHIQGFHNRFPEHGTLAEAVLAAFAFCARIAEISVDGQHRVDPLCHLASRLFDSADKIDRIACRGPQLVRALDRYKGVEAVYPAVV